jgi:hypothetical protein
MKDQLIILMEALRLSQFEIDKFRRRKQGLEVTVEHVETILDKADVQAAIHNLEPFVASPSIMPELEEPAHARHR